MLVFPLTVLDLFQSLISIPVTLLPTGLPLASKWDKLTVVPLGALPVAIATPIAIIPGMPAVNGLNPGIS